MTTVNLSEDLREEMEELLRQLAKSLTTVICETDTRIALPHEVVEVAYFERRCQTAGSRWTWRTAKMTTRPLSIEKYAEYGKRLKSSRRIPDPRS